MTSKQNQNNLKELLKASGYDDADHEQATIPAHIGDLSRPILRRVRALKKVQLESLQIETQFYQEVHDLEKKYQPLFDAINAKRCSLIVGEHEPTDAEADLPLLDGVSAEDLEKIEREAPVEGGEPSKGVPAFWFHTLNQVAQISDTIKEYDEAILKFLTDITSEVHDGPPGFTLNFHFAENPFFNNAVLTKYYQLDIGLDKDEPFEYDGPTVVKGQGCEIQWKEGKNVTQKIVKKKQKKGKAHGPAKFTTKMVPNESFFNFFDAEAKTLEMSQDENESDKIREDFEMGQILRDQVIPRAVLFFTGEAADDDGGDYFDDEEEDEESDEEGGGGGDGDSGDEEEEEEEEEE